MNGKTSESTGVDSIISKVYYDVKSGFGSIEKTLKAAQLIDKTITRNQVKTFLDKQNIRQGKKRRGDNSWIPFGPREEFQIDLADFGANPEYRYALVAVDPFTKKLSVVSVKAKHSEEVAKAFHTVLVELGVPNYIYSDEGSEFTGPAFKQKLDEFAIDPIVTSTAAPFAERAIRTLRDGIASR